MVFWLIFYLILICYSIVILSASAGWLSLSGSNNKLKKDQQTYISVIIPFRNEENNLQRMFDCIASLKYNNNYFEVVFIDDHSKDRGLEMVKSFAGSRSNIKFFQLNQNQKGKKEAVDMGIKRAKGEVCLLTDADCILQKEWLNAFNIFYIENKKPSMIIGLVDYLSDNYIFQHIFRLEFLSLIITGAGLAGINLPVYCNSANLAIKRSDYPGIDSLRKEISSGDDVFLLHELSRLKKPIKVLKKKEGIVYTIPPLTIQEFLRQRIRWGSKAKNYKNTMPVILAFLVFFTAGILITGLIYGIQNKSYTFFLYGVAIKIVTDTFLFLSGASFFNLYRLIIFIVPLEIFYPFYIMITALAGIKKPFTWKGR